MATETSHIYKILLIFRAIHLDRAFFLSPFVFLRFSSLTGAVAKNLHLRQLAAMAHMKLKIAFRHDSCNQEKVPTFITRAGSFEKCLDCRLRAYELQISI